MDKQLLSCPLDITPDTVFTAIVLVGHNHIIPCQYQSWLIRHHSRDLVVKRCSLTGSITVLTQRPGQHSLTLIYVDTKQQQIISRARLLFVAMEIVPE